MAHWEVIVGNIGTVYAGTNGFDALSLYNTYLGLSKRAYGRVANEPVVLVKDEEVHKEYVPCQEE